MRISADGVLAFDSLAVLLVARISDPEPLSPADDDLAAIHMQVMHWPWGGPNGGEELVMLIAGTQRHATGLLSRTRYKIRIERTFGSRLASYLRRTLEGIGRNTHERNLPKPALVTGSIEPMTRP